MTSILCFGSIRILAIQTSKKKVCNFVGRVASPVLANLALDGLERALRTRFPKPKSGYNAKVNLVRYCDGMPVQA